MQIEYTMTVDDLREGVTSISPPTQRESPLLNSLAWLFLFAAMTFNAIPLSTFAARAAHTWQPQQNLWLTISPSLCVASYLLISVLLSPSIARQSARGKPRRGFGNISLFGAIWILPALWPQLAIYWTPGDGNILWAAVAPWMLYFAVVRLILARRRNRNLDEIWAKAISLHRPNRVDVTSEAIASADGLVEHRYQWAHFKRYNETANLLLLVTEDGELFFVPKRAVFDDSTMDQLKMLISENIADGNFKPKVTAFPVIMPSGT